MDVTWVILLGIAGLGHIYLAINFFFASKGFQHDDGSKLLLCYFSLDETWPDNGTLHPAMNATLCTHLILINTVIKDGQIAPASPDDVTRYFSKVPLLRQQNPALKIIICNGGGGNHGFTPILASAANRSKFVSSAAPFLKKYDFDGLDIDFEFPGWQLPVQQRKNFTVLLQELRTALDHAGQAEGRKYTLSAAVAAGRAVMEIYDVPALAKSLDFINLMCYDYYGYAVYDPVTGYNSPLYPQDWQKKIVIRGGNIGWSSYEWHKRGMPKEKIMVGIPTYARTWTLMDPERFHGHDAPATGPGKECVECTFPWVCKFLNTTGTVSVRDVEAGVPYAYRGDQWISYDDVMSQTLKTQWILQNGFGGIMVYALNSDDYYGNACGLGRFPLLSAIKGAMNKTWSETYMYAFKR
ncbi:acidic mammalian chitinase-like [Mya arenaria]|uniref:acidic mammalian chitinase-like n=1 Tax=Mya arenaria TaxID=6604 RepID=UPI0022E5235F|nr:acidic mammalian chitinase-like [Mya arenaria]XP_052806985.1 acidic mammalian chitinase-like [Mya arenaria]